MIKCSEMEFIEKKASNKDKESKESLVLVLQENSNVIVFFVRLLNIITIELHILIESIYSLFGSSSNMS